MKILSDEIRRTDAYIIRKPVDLANLRREVEYLKYWKEKPARIFITRTIRIDADLFEELVSDFLAYSAFAKRCTEMLREDAERVRRQHPTRFKLGRFIEIRSSETGISILVDTQGYDYMRYVALEVPSLS